MTPEEKEEKEKELGAAYSEEVGLAEFAMSDAMWKLGMKRKILNLIADHVAEEEMMIGESGASFRVGTPERAREICGLLLELEGMETFEKHLSTYVREGKEPEWYWGAKVVANPPIKFGWREVDYWVFVYPATPQEGCQPVINYQTYEPVKCWVCQREK